MKKLEKTSAVAFFGLAREPKLGALGPEVADGHHLGAHPAECRPSNRAHLGRADWLPAWFRVVGVADLPAHLATLGAGVGICATAALMIATATLIL